jgi:hypothetical protein
MLECVKLKAMYASYINLNIHHKLGQNDTNSKQDRNQSTSINIKL